MNAVFKLVEKEKVCTKCKVSKSVNVFDGYGRGRLHPHCQPCRLIDKRKNVVSTENGRNCIKCKQSKSWDEFAKDIHGFNQKTATCKSCRSEKHRKAYQDNPAVRRSGIKNRPDKLKRIYGITYADVLHTFDSQHGRCANHGCSRKISLEVKGSNKERAVIDHNHTTGKFRALLCTKCNLSLGIIESNPAIFIGLMDYLRKHN